MLRLGDITTAQEAYRQSPQIARGEVRLLWHDDSWDGPESGILLYRGERCWFQMVAENEVVSSQWYRRFAVVRMSPEQIAEEERWHELFRQQVGTHTDYDEAGNKQPRSGVRPQEQWRHYYDAAAHRTPRDLSGNEVLGWFEW